MIRTLLLLVTSVLLLVTVACASNEDDDAAITEQDLAEDPEPTPTATPEPEPTPTPTAEAAADDDEVQTPEEDDGSQEGESQSDNDADSDEDRFEEDNDPPETMPDGLMEEFHDQELANLLLDLDDMPSGWDVYLEGSLPEDVDPSLGLGEMLSGPCGNDHITPEALGKPVFVGRYFLGTDLGPLFGHELYEFENEDDAVAAMETMLTQMSCQQWTAEDPVTGMDVHFSIEDFDFPDLGDETVALKIRSAFSMDVQASVQMIQHQVQDEDLAEGFESEIILVRQGHLFNTFTHLDLIGHGGLDLVTTITLATTQIEDGR